MNAHTYARHAHAHAREGRATPVRLSRKADGSVRPQNYAAVTLGRRLVSVA
jgi:hypothetical protein